MQNGESPIIPFTRNTTYMVSPLPFQIGCLCPPWKGRPFNRIEHFRIGRSPRQLYSSISIQLPSSFIGYPQKQGRSSTYDLRYKIRVHYIDWMVYFGYITTQGRITVDSWLLWRHYRRYRCVRVWKKVSEDECNKGIKKIELHIIIWWSCISMSWGVALYVKKKGNSQESFETRKHNSKMDRLGELWTGVSQRKKPPTSCRLYTGIPNHFLLKWWHGSDWIHTLQNIHAHSLDRLSRFDEWCGKRKLSVWSTRRLDAWWRHGRRGWRWCLNRFCCVRMRDGVWLFKVRRWSWGIRWGKVCFRNRNGRE